MVDKRNKIIDFLRGIVILDMMAVHYSKYFNIIPNINISKLIGYTDFAIEGFIILSGFMVGNYYFEKFKKDKKAVIRRLLNRTFEIIKIQYLMILTISLPLAITMGNMVTQSDTTISYIIKSLLFLNQVPLLHILPTFIPLFLIAIPILYLLEKDMDFLVLLISITFFIIGNFYPYLFNISDIRDKTIFPVILWQIYFVIGVILGKKSYLRGNELPTKILPHFILSIVIFSILSFWYFGHHIYPYLGGIKDMHNITVKKFPLNILGLFYHGSILYIIFCIIILLWRYINGYNALFRTLTLLGRYSLLAFVIHVYFFRILDFINYNMDMSRQIHLLLIAMNIIIILVILKYFAKKQPSV